MGQRIGAAKRQEMLVGAPDGFQWDEKGFDSVHLKNG